MTGDSQYPEAAEPPPQPVSAEPATRPRLRSNAISLVGAALATASFAAVGFFMLDDFIFGERGAYTTLIYPPLLLLVLLGLGLIPIGMIRESRHRAQGQPPTLLRTVSIDLRRMTQPGFFAVFIAICAAAVFFVLGAGTASMKVLEFTESSEFCGSVCHSAMGPELAVYERSAHARVDCVACHVGPGVESYVRAKLNGLKQVYSIASGHMVTPIPTPIDNQRPARYTCEGCHWRGLFRGELEHVKTYFRANEANTPVQIRMLVNVGGASNDLNGHVAGSGIHYHMTQGHEIEYIALDRQRQEIPWVRVTHPDGKVTKYNRDDEPLTEEERNELPSRVMDCLDCHNRIAHPFESPLQSVNNALNANLISRDLPFIKREASRALDGKYQEKEAALSAIAEHLDTFYRENYPDIAREKRGEVVTSIRTVQLIYENNFFPELKASWAAHPNNLGHRDSAGCFRCHNDEMNSDDGESLFVDCQTCHIILAVGENVEAVASHENGVDFWHPDDEDTLDEYTDCSDCHDGGASLYED